MSVYDSTDVTVLNSNNSVYQQFHIFYIPSPVSKIWHVQWKYLFLTIWQQENKTL
jgi:hypothetical protein